MTGVRAVVVGAGIVGLASAWRLAQRAVEVTIVDPDPGRAASGVAAGMLAPVTEAHHGQDHLLELRLAGAARWPDFAAELAAVAGADLDLARSGTLAVARDRADLAVLEHLGEHLTALGHRPERLTSPALREREPALAPTVRGGLWVAGDHQVDPRRCTQALRRALDRRGVRTRTDEVVAVEPGVARLASGQDLSADHVVVCAGWATAGLLGLPVRPVKGQILRLGATERSLLPGHVVRGLDVYVVPRPSGEVVVGATTEEVGPDRTVTGGAVRRLLDEAWRLVPGIDEAPLLETAAGLRPASPDGAPLLGTLDDGLHVATGHHRNGVLLAPLTADAVADAVSGDGWPSVVTACSPARFPTAVVR